MIIAPIYLPFPLGIILSFIWGAIWGSFANVVILRLPLGKSIIWPGSHCFSCGHKLGVLDNIPIFSYIFLKAKCRYCGAGFSARYPLTESLLGILTLFLYLNSGLRSHPLISHAYLVFLTDFIFLFFLFVLSFIDWETFILPNKLVYPFIIFTILTPPLVKNTSWSKPLVGFLLGSGIIFLVSISYKIIRKREGLGLGDAKLLGALVAFSGPLSLPFIIFAASTQGIIFALFAYIFKLNWPNPKPYKSISTNEDFAEIMAGSEKGWQLKPLPFGPFLSLAAFEYLLLGSNFIK
ncbi:MAG: prepilin peptidase, partial [Deltaproteobacteria bacterium]|nr:prepilin peptidase [Deltaproteobacteria bacterium]